MPYKIVKSNNKWFVQDNAGIRLPSKGFPSKKLARKQEIAVVLSQSKRLNKPISYFLAKEK